MNPELFNMSGHGFYIWMSYGMMLLAIIVELMLLKSKRARALAQARQVSSEAPARRARVQAN